MIKGIGGIHSYTNSGGRSSNEDVIQVLTTDNRVLVLAADGIGGEAGGGIAASAAVNSILKSLEKESISSDLLYDAVLRANQDVLKCMEDQSPRTTIAVLWLDQEQALTAAVGDTRIYQFRSGDIRFRTMDHTVAQLAVKAGKLTEDRLREVDERFQLIYALGTEDEIRIDIESLDINSGDCFLICTDGFWECVNEQEMIEDLKQSESTGKWLTAMKNRVKKKQVENSDNYSAVVLSLL